MMTRIGRRRFPILLAAIAALLALFGAPALPSTAAFNPALPPPQGFVARHLLPGQIRLSWWRNIDVASHEKIDSYQYRYRVQGERTWLVEWTTVNQTMLPGTTEIRNYNKVVLENLDVGTDYHFYVRSRDSSGGTSRAVSWLETAIGRQTFSIEADRGPVEGGGDLFFTVSRDQEHGLGDAEHGPVNVILRISETGDMLPQEGRIHGYWYEELHFGYYNMTRRLKLETVNDRGGPESDSEVKVEVMSYPLYPDNPDNEHLYLVHPTLGSATRTVTASEGSSQGGAAEPLTAAFEGLPASHDGETAFTFRIVFSEAVSVTPEAMRTRVLTVEGGAVTGATRGDGETGVWAIAVTPDTREALSISLPPAADCDADGAVCTSDGRALSIGAAHIVGGPGPEIQTQEQALTAEFQGLPEAHDGESALRFQVAFSEGINISYTTLRDDAFTVSGGEVTGARRVNGRHDLWEITVAPDSDPDVTITLPAGRECEVSGAICTRGENRRRLSNSPSATIAGPADEPERNTAATGTPTISGTPQVGEELTASMAGISDADGLDNATFTYQWLADDTAIQGATGSTYALATADEGKAVKVQVSFTDDEGNEETLTSAATEAVAAAEPTEPPAAPTNLTSVVNDDGTVTLGWDAPDDDSVAGYQILRRRPTMGETKLLVYVADTGGTAITFTDTEVTASTRHVYRVKAINAAGLGKWSNYVRVEP